MKKSLDHLPARKQAELRRVVEIIKEAFAEAIRHAARRTAEERQDPQGHPLRIVCAGRLGA